MFKGQFFVWLGYAFLIQLGFSCLLKGNTFWGIVGILIAVIGIINEIKQLK